MPAASRLALLAALAFAACGGPPEDPVERLQHELSSAAQDRDAAAVGEHLAADFRGEGGIGKAETVATVRRSLAGYDRVGVQVFDLQREDDTRVRFRVAFTGKPKDVGGLAGLLPEAAVYEFELELSRGGAALLVHRASWRVWTPPASR